MNYHFVWIPKYRRRVLTGPVKTYLEELIPAIAAEHDIEVLALEIQPDHVHLFVSAPPRYAPARIVNLFKGTTSRRLRQRFPRLRWVHKDKLWTRTYYVGSAGQVSSETIRGMPARVKKDTKEHLILTESFPLPREGYEVVLARKMMAATRIWNACVWESREAKKAEGHWPGEAQLKAKLKTFVTWKELAAQSAQAVVEEYFEAVRAYRTHRANGHAEQRPPGFKPKQSLRTLTWKKEAISFQDSVFSGMRASQRPSV